MNRLYPNTAETPQTIQNKITGTTGATPNLVTMAQLAQGLDQTGYGELYLRQHCSMHDVMNTLLSAAPNRPMMVATGGANGPFRAVVVTGHRVTKGRRKRVRFEATDATQGAQDGFTDLYDCGEYVKMDLQGRPNYETVLPRIGIIKGQQ